MSYKRENYQLRQATENERLMSKPGRPKKGVPPTFGAPQKPSHLSPEAARQRDKLVAEITASSLQATPAHRATISPASTIAADNADAWAAVQENGADVMGL
jgi:hypothetical protein